MTNYDDEEEEFSDIRDEDDDDYGGGSKNNAKPMPPKPEYIKDSNDYNVSTIESIMAKNKRENATVADDDDENLGDNFEDSPWVPPSLEKAMEFKMKNVLRLGNATLGSIKVVDASDLGASTCLYFRFIKSIAIYMFISSILSKPSIIFCYYGQRISMEN